MSDNSVSLLGANGYISWNVVVDRGIFGLNQPVNFKISEIKEIASKTVSITEVSVGIRQDVTLTAEGVTRTITEYIAKPDVRKGVKREKLKETGEYKWSGEVTALVEAAHVRKKDHTAVDALSSSTGDGFTISHAFEVKVKFSGGMEVIFDGPAVFVDADKETQDWVIRNLVSKSNIESK